MSLILFAYAQWNKTKCKKILPFRTFNDKDIIDNIHMRENGGTLPDKGAKIILFILTRALTYLCKHSKISWDQIRDFIERKIWQ
jgi:hypothetical protein